MRYVFVVFSFALLLSCRPETYVPKPTGYYLLDTPQHAYKSFNDPSFPYSFEYPAYAQIVHDTSFFGHKPENPYWIDIVIPSLDATFYISYKDITPQQPFAKLLEDAHKLTWFHDKRADYIEHSVFRNRYGVTGLLFTVGGNAASTYQFVATDTVKHFLRGALYFNVTPNADSLKPVSDFLERDLERMLQTMKFK